MNYLEAAVRLLQTKSVRVNEAGDETDDMVDTGSERASSSGNKNSVGGIVDGILFKIRYLKNDVQPVDRAAKLMQEVELLEKTLRISTGEIRGVCVDYDDLQQKRKRVECIVRESMKCDKEVHGSKSHFDELVCAKPDKRMRACGVEGSSLVSAVMSMLEKNPPPTAADIPTVHSGSSGCACATSSTRRS